MSPIARIVAPGFPHHVTQRGNRGADVFETDSDRKAYLRFLKHYADKRGVSVWAYCLMTNHIHLVVNASLGGGALCREEPGSRGYGRARRAIAA